MTALLELESVTFSYPEAENVLLDGVSLRLTGNERIGLLGDNGSGKTTLLHIAAGLIRPASGRVLYDGRPCETEKDFATARRSLGYLLQHSEDQLFCPTVLEDVAFGPLNTGLDEKEAISVAEKTLDRLRLGHLANRNGTKLSGGEKKLAALATVLAMAPRFLFLDEPTNDLDTAARERLIEELRGLGLPLIAISHDRDFLERVCSSSLLLHAGRLTGCAAIP